jgi:hypothetical protein
MTDAERSKLNGVETGANKYVHPSTHSADMISDSATKVMMTAAERTKLNGIETGANNYVHPDNSSTRHVTDAEKAKWYGFCPDEYEYKWLRKNRRIDNSVGIFNFTR